VLTATLLAALLAAEPTRAQKSHVPASQWWPEVREIDAQLRRHRWKPARKQARKLAETVSRRSWYGRDLGKVLAELSLYQAVAEANLGLRREAIWHWHMASNLDLAMRRRDLSPYGDAAKLLLEFPLRGRGQVPAPFRTRRPPPGSRVEPPELPDIEAYPVFNNTGATLEGSGDFKAELIIDRAGALHQPVVLSDHLNPVIVFHVLNQLPELPPFQPVRYDGEPSDTVFVLTVRFHVVRW
jgi:hypothetical protein